MFYKVIILDLTNKKTCKNLDSYLSTSFSRFPLLPGLLRIPFKTNLPVFLLVKILAKRLVNSSSSILRRPLVPLSHIHISRHDDLIGRTLSVYLFLVFGGLVNGCGRTDGARTNGCGRTERDFIYSIDIPYRYSLQKKVYGLSNFMKFSINDLLRDFLKTRVSRCMLHRHNVTMVQIETWFLGIIHCTCRFESVATLSIPPLTASDI